MRILFQSVHMAAVTYVLIMLIRPWRWLERAAIAEVKRKHGVTGRKLCPWDGQPWL